MSTSNSPPSSNGSNNSRDHSLRVNVAETRVRIPKPRSLVQFILAPSRWKAPDFGNMRRLYHRIKTNLLYFQTNYLICGTIMFFAIIIMSMKTLLTGIVSSIVLTFAGLFFLDHIPAARQIKQNYPTLVIIAGIALIIVTWHALRTILLVVGAALLPIPIYLLHASFRCSDNLVDSGEMGGDYYINTPVGQLMQLIGIDPRPSLTE